MKKATHLKLTSTLCVLVTFLAGSVVYAHNDTKSGKDVHEAHDSQPVIKKYKFPEWRNGFKRKLKKLDLSEAQQEEIRQLRHNHHSAMKEKYENIHQLKKQRRALLKAEQVDESAVRELSVRIAEVKTVLLIKKEAMKREIKLLLTDEQREKFNSIKVRYRKKMAEHHSH